MRKLAPVKIFEAIDMEKRCSRERRKYSELVAKQVENTHAGIPDTLLTREFRTRQGNLVVTLYKELVAISGPCKVYDMNAKQRTWKTRI